MPAGMNITSAPIMLESTVPAMHIMPPAAVTAAMARAPYPHTVPAKASSVGISIRPTGKIYAIAMAPAPMPKAARAAFMFKGFKGHISPCIDSLLYIGFVFLTTLRYAARRRQKPFIFLKNLLRRAFPGDIIRKLACFLLCPKRGRATRP